MAAEVVGDVTAALSREGVRFSRFVGGCAAVAAGGAGRVLPVTEFADGREIALPFAALEAVETGAAGAGEVAGVMDVGGLISPPVPGAVVVGFAGAAALGGVGRLGGAGLAASLLLTEAALSAADGVADEGLKEGAAAEREVEGWGTVRLMFTPEMPDGVLATVVEGAAELAGGRLKDEEGMRLGAEVEDVAEGEVVGRGSVGFLCCSCCSFFLLRVAISACLRLASKSAADVPLLLFTAAEGGPAGCVAEEGAETLEGGVPESAGVPVAPTKNGTKERRESSTLSAHHSSSSSSTSSHCSSSLLSMRRTSGGSGCGGCGRWGWRRVCWTGFGRSLLAAGLLPALLLLLLRQDLLEGLHLEAGTTVGRGRGSGSGRGGGGSGDGGDGKRGRLDREGGDRSSGLDDSRRRDLRGRRVSLCETTAATNGTATATSSSAGHDDKGQRGKKECSGAQEIGAQGGAEGTCVLIWCVGCEGVWDVDVMQGGMRGSGSVEGGRRKATHRGHAAKSTELSMAAISQRRHHLHQHHTSPALDITSFPEHATHIQVLTISSTNPTATLIRSSCTLSYAVSKPLSSHESATQHNALRLTRMC